MPSLDDNSEVCAACGEIGDSLKACTACRLVKYCNRDCQKNHRSAHKRTCKQRAAELYDEKFFQQPRLREECPVCFLPLPVNQGYYKPHYQLCCGKIVCSGCIVAVQDSENGEGALCPFCRKPGVFPSENTEIMRRINKRIDAGDAEAILLMGHYFGNGLVGVPQDMNKAMEFWNRAAAMGFAKAHYQLGLVYCYGHSVVEADMNKAKHHLEIATIGGYVAARDQLATLEAKLDPDNNVPRAVRHWMIAASSGYDDSMDAIKTAFFEYRPPLVPKQMVTKEQYEQTLRAWKESSDEMKSDHRERAAEKERQKRGN